MTDVLFDARYRQLVRAARDVLYQADLLRSDAVCVQCRKPERPWRRMMWYPFDGSSGGAFICSDECWDRFEVGLR